MSVRTFLVRDTGRESREKPWKIPRASKRELRHPSSPFQEQETRVKKLLEMWRFSFCPTHFKDVSRDRRKMAWMLRQWSRRVVWDPWFGRQRLQHRCTLQVRGLGGHMTTPQGGLWRSSCSDRPLVSHGLRGGRGGGGGA